jgi:hypothetical protein
MTDSHPPDDPIINQTIDLLEHYGFNVEVPELEKFLTVLLKTYPASWIRLAVIEAIYQGRSKTIAIERILEFWLRKSRVVCHFSEDFEKLVCGNIPAYAIPFVIATKPNSKTIPPRPPQQETLTALAKERDAEMGQATEATELDQAVDQGHSLESTPQSTPRHHSDLHCHNEKTTHYSIDREIEQFIPVEDTSNTYNKLIHVINPEEP